MDLKIIQAMLEKVQIQYVEDAGKPKNSQDLEGFSEELLKTIKGLIKDYHKT